MTPRPPGPRRAVHDPATERIGAVDRALALLDAFSPTRPTLSLSELAEFGGRSKSTASRLLASLERAHIVRRCDDGRFAFGSAVPRMHAVYAASFSLVDAVLPQLRDLVRRTRESASFHVLQGGSDLCVARVDSPRAIRDHTKVGDLRALDASIAGQVLRAFAGARGTRAAGIRREHLFVADGSLVPEVAGIAAPVFDAAGAPAGALLLTMPSTRLQPGHAAEVRRAARATTARLGGNEPLAGLAPRRSAPR